MIKILFLIHDLGRGGAEKVLVNLVNHMDRKKFEISVTVLFGGGVNEQYLNEDIHFHAVFPRMIPANTKWMKLLTPSQLHKIIVKGQYDIEVSYLEGPSARIISGCPNSITKLVSWIHVEQHSKQKIAASFRSFQEATYCYNRFDQIICVSEYVKKDFVSLLHYKKKCDVLYNTVDSEYILKQSRKKTNLIKNDGKIKLIAVGTLKKSKGFDRLIRVVDRLKDQVHLYILGAGPMQKSLEFQINRTGLHDSVTLLGYDVNPYKYLRRCDLFVCSSFAEGFSTAVTEALIVGIPVCTVNVSGMEELLGKNNEYGYITINSERALYQGVKKLVEDSALLDYYREKAVIRGKKFNTEETVRKTENMFLSLLNQ